MENCRAKIIACALIALGSMIRLSVLRFEKITMYTRNDVILVFSDFFSLKSQLAVNSSFLLFNNHYYPLTVTTFSHLENCFNL